MYIIIFLTFTSFSSQIVQSEEYLSAADTDIIRRVDQEASNPASNEWGESADFATDVYDFGIQFNESNVPLIRKKRAIDPSISSFFTWNFLSWVGIAKTSGVNIAILKIFLPEKIT
jgi:hypothetical protein